MCGIIGLYDKKRTEVERNNLCLELALEIRHRGPDADGVWSHASGITFAHRRLSILDLSELGRQPMVSPSGRYVMTFNGEIYNFLELKEEIRMRGHQFRGGSDTEVLLAAFEFYGLKETLKKSVGMFALAVFDIKENTLFLARDRIGEKPLYYGQVGDELLFASELKPFLKHWYGRLEIDRNALALLMVHNYIPAPLSAFRQIKKLEAGSLLEIPLSSDGTSSILNLQPEPFWRLDDVVRDRRRIESEEDALHLLETQLKKTIQRQMIADVPLGAFLSGGLDSALIVAIMQSLSSRKIKTYTIGFSEVEYNEAHAAKSVAGILGTDHTEMYVSGKDALDCIPRLPDIYDEPFSDSSQIPTYLLSKLTKQHVTVCLSGDGGDELFGGYNRYAWAESIWDSQQHIPGWLRRISSQIIGSIREESWTRAYSDMMRLLGARPRHRNFGQKMQKLSSILAASSFEEVYLQLISHWRGDDVIAGLGSVQHPRVLDILKSQNLDNVEKMMFADTKTYLPDDIMVKVDRASMAVSLETRAPYLDHELIELMWSFPLKFKLRGGKTKWIQRELLSKYLPREQFERPKSGFAVPLDSWLRHELRDWAEDLLSEKKLQQGGWFKPEVVRKKWLEHLSGEKNWQYHLWDVLMLQAWRQKWKI